MVTPQSTVTPDPMEAPLRTRVGMQRQSLGLLKSSAIRRCPWKQVVGKGDPVPDEHLVFDGHPFADERVAGDFAISADGRPLLDLDECADPRVITDVTPIEIYKIADDDIFPKSNGVGDRFHALRLASLSRWVIMLRPVQSEPSATFPTPPERLRLSATERPLRESGPPADRSAHRFRTVRRLKCIR